MSKVRDSRYVPRADCDTPLAGWKRLDLVQDVLLTKDLQQAEAEGIINIEEWVGKIKTGDPTA